MMFIKTAMLGEQNKQGVLQYILHWLFKERGKEVKKKEGWK